MTLNDLERQNKGGLWISWRFQAATQVIHKEAPRRNYRYTIRWSR